MPNTVERLNAAIADFVQEPRNSALLPGTGGYSTPFRGSLFGCTRAADVERELMDRRASILLLGSNPNCPESLEHIRSTHAGVGDWPDFERQAATGYFGHAVTGEDGMMRGWDPLHDPGKMGPGQHAWTFFADAVRAGLGSLDEVALANVLSWGSSDVRRLVQVLQEKDSNLLGRVLSFADAQLETILRALRPRLIICPKSVSDQRWARTLVISRKRAKGLLDVSPVNLTGRPYRMTLGECVGNGSTYPILFMNHPSSLRFIRQTEWPKIANAIADAVGQVTVGV